MKSSLVSAIWKQAFIVGMLVYTMFCGAGLRSAAAAPGWEKEILYFVLLDRFENGTTMNDYDVQPRNPRAFHGGDLHGLLQRLDYLQELGVTAIWLSPIYQNRPMPFYGQDAYHGYWPWDFFRIDPRFGNEFKLKELRRELRKRNMKLVLDMVVNHAGYDAPLVRAQPFLFHDNPEISDWNDRNQVETYGVFGLPDFASERGIVQQFHQAVSSHWLQLAEPDGFRLDAVKHVPLSFWKTFNRRLSDTQGDDFLLLGEQLQGDPAVIGETLRQGRFTSLFDYPLHYTLIDVFAKGGSCTALGLRFAQDYRYGDARRMATFLDNHDVERFYSLCGNDLQKYRLALIVMMTARGIPTLCYGDETPLVSTTGVFGTNRPDMKFVNDSEAYGLVKMLIALRKQYPALQSGVQQHLGMSNSWYAFARLLPDQAVITAVNNSSHSVRLALELPGNVSEHGVVTDLLTLTEGRIRGGKLHVQVEPKGAVIYVVNPTRPCGFAEACRRAEAALRDPFVYGRVRVTFRLTTKPSAEGKVFVCGALPSLGEWNPERAVPCVRDAAGTWSATVDLPARAVTDFKFLVKAGDKVIWPDGWWNYTLEVPSTRRLTVEKPWMQ